MASGECTHCSYVYCPVGNYRMGSCSGTSNNFTCLAQPTCKTNQYLSGSSNTKQGKCEACLNAACAPSQYRTGSCSGTSNGYQCLSQPVCNVGEYLDTTTATNTAMGQPATTTTATATATATTIRQKGQCRAKTLCKQGELLFGATASSAGQCNKCISIAFQPAKLHRHPGCQLFTKCKKGQFEVQKPTAFSDRRCGTHGKCTSDQ